MKNALAEWQHKEMLSASNTGGYFAVVHPNDTVRQGGHGSARYDLVRCAKVRFGVACLGKAVVARLGISWRGMVSQDVVWSGGQDLVRLGGARLGPVRSVQARRSWSGKGWRGQAGRGLAWRSGPGVARPGVMRSGVASEA